MKAIAKKVKCPQCGNVMDPIKANPSDKSIKLMSRVYKAKRFICHACLHEKKTYDRIRNQLAIIAIENQSKN